MWILHNLILYTSWILNTILFYSQSHSFGLHVKTQLKLCTFFKYEVRAIGNKTFKNTHMCLDIVLQLQILLFIIFMALKIQMQQTKKKK